MPSVGGAFTTMLALGNPSGMEGADAIPVRDSALAVIPNSKGHESNPYDTGWVTETFDLSGLGFDFDRINLLLDDDDATNGTYRLYVDYIRIFVY